MSKQVVVEVPREQVPEHPAVRAWARLQPGYAEPAALWSLKATRKSQVYRLAGAGPGGAAVIAKSGRDDTAGYEHLLYERVLARLPVTTLSSYGYVPSEDGKGSWLFLEDARGEEYSPGCDDHRELAARWLAEMHIAAQDRGLCALLPDRGERHYRQQLQSARATIHSNFSNPALARHDRTTLENLLEQLEEVESRWVRVVDFCRELPCTLVHGDFVGKNLRVRCDARHTLLVFDWEMAGWGVPAADLAPYCLEESDCPANPDVALYWAAVRNSWPALGPQGCGRLVYLGRLFRYLAAIQWASPWLEYAWVERPMRCLRDYAVGLTQAIQALDREG
jgi:hypothetical protein